MLHYSFPEACNRSRQPDVSCAIRYKANLRLLKKDVLCLQFKNNTDGSLSVYVFDTSNGSVNKTGGDYLASACRFTINLKIERAADAPIRQDQFYYGQS